MICRRIENIFSINTSFIFFPTSKHFYMLKLYPSSVLHIIRNSITLKAFYLLVCLSGFFEASTLCSGQLKKKKPTRVWLSFRSFHFLGRITRLLPRCAFSREDLIPFRYTPVSRFVGTTVVHHFIVFRKGE